MGDGEVKGETISAHIKSQNFQDTIGTSNRIRYLAEAEIAQKEASTYREEAEKATATKDLFKNLLLAGNKSLEGYIAQTRAQADQSFQVSKYVAIVGFALIATGVAMGIGLNAIGLNRLDAAYLTSVSGIITEFISGVFFYLYNKTIEQLNRFHDKLLVSQHILTSLLAAGSISDKKSQEDTLSELAKTLMKSSG